MANEVNQTFMGATSSVQVIAPQNQTSTILVGNEFADQFTFGGGATTTVLNIPGITTNSIRTADIYASTNTCYIASLKVLTPGQLTVQFSADPGAGTVIGVRVSLVSTPVAPL